MWTKTKAFLDLFPLTWKAYGAVRASRMAAALAFYTVLSLSPLLIVAVGITKAILGRDDVRLFILLQISNILGDQAAVNIAPMIDGAAQDNSVGFTLVGLAILLFSASGAFTQVVDILNRIWRVQQPRRPYMQVLKERLTGFIMVLLAGATIVLLFVLTTSLSAISRYGPTFWPFDGVDWLGWLRTGLTTAVIILIFALMFRVLPDAFVAWRDVWVGAILTGLLFAVGLHAIGWYLSFSTVGSAYGAAGSLLVTLLAVYYAAQIFLLGGQFTYVFSLSEFGASHRHEKAPPRLDFSSPQNHGHGQGQAAAGEGEQAELTLPQ